MPIQNITLELPAPESWPYKEYISRLGLRYYELAEEVTVPSYNEYFWKNINPDTVGCCIFLQRAGIHILPSGSSINLNEADKRVIYNCIKVEERRLQKEHLYLFDRLSGKTENLCLPSYTCYWPSFEVFKKDSPEMFSKGRIYLLCPEKIDEQIRNKKEKISSLANAKCELIYDTVSAASEDGSTQTFSLYYIEVCAPAAELREKAWLETSKVLAESLKGQNNELKVPESFSRNPDAFFVSSPDKGRLY